MPQCPPVCRLATPRDCGVNGVATLTRTLTTTLTCAAIDLLTRGSLCHAGLSDGAPLVSDSESRGITHERGLWLGVGTETNIFQPGAHNTRDTPT